MPKILITCPPMLIEQDHARALCARHNLQPDCAEVVQTLTEEELLILLPEYEGWIAGDDPATRAVLSAGAAGKLRAVVKWGVGVDNIDQAACRDLSLGFTNTPGMFSDEVADIALAYLITLTRQIHIVHQAVRSGDWPKPQGISLRGKRAAVIGYGSIGRAICDRLKTCGVKITAYDPAVSASTDSVAVSTWPNGLEYCDFIILCCALTEENHHLINESVLQTVQLGTCIINVSRGPLIDEQALVSALHDGRISAAALDVFEAEPLPLDSPLREFEQCLFGTHNASNTLDAVRKTNEIAIESLVRLLND